MDEEALGPTKESPANSLRFLFAALCLILSICVLYRLLALKTTVGATVDVTELSSGMTLRARVDTGASINSLHCLDIQIEDTEDEPEKNSNKKVRFLVEGPTGERHWLESTVLGYSGIRSAAGTSSRYLVRLQLTCAGVTKDTIISLNDRSAMKYPLLLGRDFLKDDFVVDVSRDNPDFP
jgi:hypothetical protein